MKDLKKVIFYSILSVIVGILSALYVYNLNNKEEKEDIKSLYVLQYGVYSNEENLNKALKKLDNYSVSFKDNKYYVYLGFSTNKENISILKDIYKKNNINLYLKRININNNDFYTNLEQYDVLLSNVSNNKDFLSINNAILSSYDEIILGN